MCIYENEDIITKGLLQPNVYNSSSISYNNDNNTNNVQVCGRFAS
jgi:hypothetical protein